METKIFESKRSQHFKRRDKTTGAECVHESGYRYLTPREAVAMPVIHIRHELYWGGTTVPDSCRTVIL
jgi:hypothetical protein